MADRVPEAAGASSTHILTKQQTNAWRHALTTAGYLFDQEANRLLMAIAAAPVIEGGDAVESARSLGRHLKQQAREAWAAADLLENASEVTVRTAVEGGAA